MWQRSFTKTFSGISKQQIWSLWTNVNEWHLWDPDLEYAQMTEPFAVGSRFQFKPKGGPLVNLQLVAVEPLAKYADRVKFLGATLIGTHQMQETAEGLKMITTIQVSGPLGFIWRKLVAEDIVNTLPEQMEALVELARRQT